MSDCGVGSGYLKFARNVYPAVDMRFSQFCAAMVLICPLSGCATSDPLGVQTPPSEPRSIWAEFSARPSLARRITDTTVHVGYLSLVGQGRDARTEHWLRKTTNYFDGTMLVHWTDTRSCPSAQGVLSSIATMEIPRPMEGGTIEVSADGINYSLSTKGRYASGRHASLSISATGGTPLARWVEQSLATLDECWADHTPSGVS
jgi:hypothetical protein